MRPTIRVKVETFNGQEKPEYKTDEAAGADIRCPVRLEFDSTQFVHDIELDFSTAIPAGHVALLLPRGSVGNGGIGLANTVGVIDSDFRGTWRSKLFLHYWAEPQVIEKGERFLQIVIVKAEHARFFRAEVKHDTARGLKGGSTGRK